MRSRNRQWRRRRLTNSAFVAVAAEGKLLSMAVRFAVIGVMLFAINWFTHPQYLWSLWAIGGMSLALVMRAVRTLLLRNVFSRWQEQRLAHKLRRLP